MNSEELEKSLRTEFDGYLKNILAELRQDVSSLHEKIEAEFEKHKSQIESMIGDFSARLENDKHLDESFQESVAEHLRLARDEGARITAEAIAEAEKMQEESAPPISYTNIRDAISEISRQESQADILKSLVDHAAQFAPRGAFFIVKSDYFVGWRLFGKDAPAEDSAVREVFFPVSDRTVLGESIRELRIVEGAYGSYEDDSKYLERLGFGQPDRMYAIPLVARGRGVAVLYVDYGHDGTRVDVEALETMVRVAGLTVELLAASRGAKQSEAPRQTEYQQPAAAAFRSADTEQPQPQREETFREETSAAVDSEFERSESYESRETEKAEAEYAAQPEYNEQSEQSEYTGQIDAAEEYSTDDFAASNVETEQSESAQQFQPQDDYQSGYSEAADWNEAPEYGETVSNWNETPEYSDDFSIASPAEAEAGSEPAFETGFGSQENEFKSRESAFETEPEQVEETPFGTNGSYDAVAHEDVSSAQNFETTGFESQESSYTEAPKEAREPQVEHSAASAPVRTRFSERSTDLPIEVSEEERRLHNDARRFARLLVSEIKLYNEQKVKEGRDAQDLYERLREAIDRSREMYDKRVQPPVAAKFDYFHYELVNTLAEGEEAKLGAAYPGAEV